MTEQVKQFAVIDLSDINEALTAGEMQVFAGFQRQVEASRTLRGLNPKPTYILCSADEPYATLVSEMMRQGEAIKQVHQMMAAAQQQSKVKIPDRVSPPAPLKLEETEDPDEGDDESNAPDAFSI